MRNLAAIAVAASLAACYFDDAPVAAAELAELAQKPEPQPLPNRFPDARADDWEALMRGPSKFIPTPLAERFYTGPLEDGTELGWPVPGNALGSRFFIHSGSWSQPLRQLSFDPCGGQAPPIGVTQTRPADGNQAEIGSQYKLVSEHYGQQGLIPCADPGSYWCLFSVGRKIGMSYLLPGETGTMLTLTHAQPQHHGQPTPGPHAPDKWIYLVDIPENPAFQGQTVYVQASHWWRVNGAPRMLMDRGCAFDVR